MASFTFWGWQTVIVLAALSYVMGYSQGREYAEMAWPIDILVDRHLGDLPDPVRRHHDAPQAAAHLRRQLVLHAFILATRAPAYLQQPGDAGRPLFR
jgi:hypothetical protein